MVFSLLPDDYFVSIQFKNLWFSDSETDFSMSLGMQTCYLRDLTHIILLNNFFGILLYLLFMELLNFDTWGLLMRCVNLFLEEKTQIHTDISFLKLYNELL